MKKTCTIEYEQLETGEIEIIGIKVRDGKGALRFVESGLVSNKNYVPAIGVFIDTLWLQAIHFVVSAVALVASLPDKDVGQL